MSCFLEVQILLGAKLLLCVQGPAERTTRVQYQLWDTIFQRETSQFGVRQDVEAKEVPISLCVCVPLETAQPLGYDTHAWLHGQTGRWSTDGTEAWSLLSVGGELGPLISARTRTWAQETVKPDSL